MAVTKAREDNQSPEFDPRLTNVKEGPERPSDLKKPGRPDPVMVTSSEEMLKNTDPEVVEAREADAEAKLKEEEAEHAKNLAGEAHKLAKEKEKAKAKAEKKAKDLIHEVHSKDESETKDEENK